MLLHSNKEHEMAATVVHEDMEESLLSTFDQIYQDFKGGITEIQILQSNLNAEIKKRDALEFTCNSLRQDNDRLSKLYTESLSSLAEQIERRTKCQSLNEELKRMTSEIQSKEIEFQKAMEQLKQEYSTKIQDLGAQVRSSVLQKAKNEATISHLREELTAHKSHMQTLGRRLDRVRFEVESKFHLEIQDLKDCLMVEQEEKNELHKKLQELEKELLVSKMKLAEQQNDLASNRLIETLKLKIMKLRKENELLRRKLFDSQETGELEVGGGSLKE